MALLDNPSLLENCRKLYAWVIYGRQLKMPMIPKSVKVVCLFLISISQINLGSANIKNNDRIRHKMAKNRLRFSDILVCITVMRHLVTFLA